MIEIESVVLLNVVSQLLRAARNNRGRLLFAVKGPDTITIAAGGIDSYVAVWETKATYEDFKPMYLNADRLHVFLGAVVHAQRSAKIKIDKRVTITCGRHKMTLPFEDAADLRIFKPENEVAWFPHEKFVDLARTAEMAADPGYHRPQFTGAYLIVDDKFVRLVATDGFSAGYSWYERANNEEGALDVLIPASSLLAVVNMSWEDNITIYTDTAGKIFFVSDRFYVYCVPLVNKEQYPVKNIITAMGGDLHSVVSCEPASLLEKLSACSRVKMEDTPRVRFCTRTQEGIINISTKEGPEEMSFDIMLTRHSDSELRFILDGRFVGKAVSLLKAIGTLSAVELSLSDFVEWVFVTSPGLSARYAFAKIDPGAVQ